MIETPIVNPRNKMAMKWYGGSQATSWIHGDGLLYEVSRGFTLFDPHFFVENHRGMQEFLNVRFMSCSMGQLFVARKFVPRLFVQFAKVKISILLKRGGTTRL